MMRLKLPRWSPLSSCVSISVSLCVFAAGSLAQGEAPRFDHEVAAHQALACSHCHAEGVRASEVRPGAESHLTCAGAGCHSMYGETRALKGQVCQVCHQHDEPWRVSAARVKGLGEGARDHCTPFPHKPHLARSAESQCLSCHMSRDQGPSHSECVGCHLESPERAEQEEEAQPHSFARCDLCHHALPKGANNLCSLWSREAPRMRVREAFDHKTHALDVRQDPPTPLSCALCHKHVAHHSGRREGRGKWVMVLPADAMVSTCKRCHHGRPLKGLGGRRIFKSGANSPCAKCHPSFRFTARQRARGHGAGQEESPR